MKNSIEYSENSWLIVSAALILNLSFGITIAFGVFFPSIIGEFGWPRGITSIAFSIYTVVYGLTAVLSGWLVERYPVNRIIMFGGSLALIGTILSSMTTEIWHLYLTYGLLVGFGLGTYWVPSILVVSKSFDKSPRLKTAVAIVTTGTGFGTLIMPPVASFFIINFQWRMAFVLISLILFLMLLPSLLFMTPKSVSKVSSDSPKKEKSDRSFLRDIRYWLLYFGNFGGNIGQMVFLVHLPSFIVDIGFPLTTASAVVGAAGVGTILGRLAFGNQLKINIENILVVSLLIQGAMVSLLITLNSPYIFILFGFLWGFLWGIRVFAFPIILRSYFGLASFGLAYGIVNTAYGFAGLIGPPFVGYVYDVTGSYFIGFAFSGLMFLAGSISILISSKSKS